MREVARAIGIAPTSRGFGYAVLEDGEHLVAWGLTHGRPPTPEKLAHRACDLFHRQKPDTLVIQDVRGSRLGERSRRLLDLLEDVAELDGVEVVRVSLDEVRRSFAVHGLTKHDRAKAIAERFPELLPRLPAKRKPWQSQDERMAVFDAVEWALCWTLTRRGEQ